MHMPKCCFDLQMYSWSVSIWLIWTHIQRGMCYVVCTILPDVRTYIWLIWTHVRMSACTCLLSKCVCHIRKLSSFNILSFKPLLFKLVLSWWMPDDKGKFIRIFHKCELNVSSKLWLTHWLIAHVGEMTSITVIWTAHEQAVSATYSS